MSDSLEAKTTIIGALNMALRSSPNHPDKYKKKIFLF
jgi:hypothetical protein